jgi:hypothetical protein
MGTQSHGSAAGADSQTAEEETTCPAVFFVPKEVINHPKILFFEPLLYSSMNQRSEI